MKITAKLLGVPEIYVGEKRVKFSYLKIEAFIYYLLIEKTISRSKMAGLLWPEDSEKTAKKNLRNVLYHSRKNIDKDLILTPNNTILQLNQDLDISIDLEEYLQDPYSKAQLFQGEFLQGFSLRDCEEYERWVYNKRSKYLDFYYKNLQEKVSQSIADKILINVEGNLQKLIDLDNLDEENYRLLMTYYLINNRHKKILELYSDLAILLKRELAIEPGPEIKKIYEESLEKINKDQKQKDQSYYFYFGRESELAQLHQTISAFKKGSKIKSVYVEGEAGLGKSALLERAYRDFSREFEIYNIPCYEFEQDRILNSIKMFVEALSGLNKFNKLDLEDLIRKIFSIQNLYKNKREIEPDLENLEKDLERLLKNLDDSVYRIFNFEDIHWIDQYSARLLTSLILKDRSKTMFFFTARSKSNDYVEDMILILDKYGILDSISLKALSYEDGEKYVKKAMGQDFTLEKYQKIYKQAQGNPLFMAVFTSQAIEEKEIGVFNDRLVRAIKSRFTSFNKEEKDLLDLLAFFKGPFPLDIIFRLTDLDQQRTIDLLDRLEKRNILFEFEEDGLIYFDFCYEKIKDFIYLGSNQSKRKYYHQKIGNLLEESSRDYKNKLKYLEELTYHFTKAEDLFKEVQYNIEILNHYLDYSHELFPVLDHIDHGRNPNIYMESKEMDSMFASLKEKIDQIEKMDHPDLDHLKEKFFYMRGRFLIRSGNYQEGLEDINYVITRARFLEDMDYMINGYKQLIYYHIQVNQAENMLTYIEEGLKLSVKCNYHKEIGMFLRFKGLYFLMQGAYDRAEKLLKESINTFTVTEKIAREYAINIAAAHSYIGEIRLAKKDYQGAQVEFSKAIKISADKGVKSSLSIFYLNMAKTAYFVKDLSQAKKYLNKAAKLFESYDFYWKRPVLYSYLALLAFEEKDFSAIRKYFDLAKDKTKRMDDPRSKGTFEFASYIILKSTDQKTKNLYFPSFSQTKLEDLKKQGLKNLDPYRDVYEREKLMEE
ncbi:MAG: AAA family ATPase [Bacillota bacterium]|nr:AAA family ATPase [Bacillota bacterium]